MPADYTEVTRPQQVVLICLGILALLMAGITVYLVSQWRLSDVLESRGVQTTATVLSGGPERAVVEFDTDEGRRRVEIDRTGETLCPKPKGIRTRGCASIGAGTTFEIVYDPQDTGHAQPAESVDSSSWRRSAIVVALIAVACAALAAGRWRWLRQLRRLTAPDAPRRQMRIDDVALGKERKARSGELLPPGAKITLSSPSGGDKVRMRASLSPSNKLLAAGEQVEVVGEPAKGKAIAIAMGEQPWVWPRAKLRNSG